MISCSTFTTFWLRGNANSCSRLIEPSITCRTRLQISRTRTIGRRRSGLELRTRDRERKLLRKIDQALGRIEEGSYGWCDETGEEIGLKRLEARPVATMCLEAQERRELAERQFRDRDDRYR